ncbi:MAG: hypothetical protein V4640_03835 [Verrucomicrobiota bacterium]
MIPRHFLVSVPFFVATAVAATPCKVEVVDKSNGWPVPLVKLTTTSDVTFITDNAGVVAFDTPELMGSETWLGVSSDGYEIPADGFGNRGVRFTPKPGGTFEIELERKQIAKRLGRLTGSGIFAESQKLGGFGSWKETGAMGSDTVQTAAYKGKLFWVWGDTNLQHYPLGIFNTPVATSSLKPLISQKPPTAIVYDYVRNEKGAPRGTIEVPGEGPVWVSGFISLPDAQGAEHLVATWAKIKGTLAVQQFGLAEWNDKAEKFDIVNTFWQRSEKEPEPPKVYPDGHPVIAKDADGKPWVYFNGPPNFKCPATYEAWKDSSQWQHVERQMTMKDANGGGDVTVASGSIAWNNFRKRWILVFQQKFGKPSVFGEVWYCESKSPEGPWGPAVKVATHENYTFYNIQIDHQLTSPDEPLLLFEGTYTTLFSDNKHKTPRYDYNQMLYRLDLDDPALKPAQKD